MIQEHRYSIEIEWTGNRGQGTRVYADYDRNHVIKVEGKPDLAGSADPSFRGDPTLHNPEELFVAALSACHMLWYLHLCAKAGVVVISYVDRAEGVMEVSQTGAGQFREVTLRPYVLIQADSSRDQALELHATANEKCFIANSVSCPVGHAPVVSVDSATQT